MKGTQSRLRFLPARTRISSSPVLGEEFGFLGVVFVFLFYFLFLPAVHVRSQIEDRAGSYIIFMVACC